MGAISLRRRREPSLHVDVYEVRLGEEFLMSSLFTVAELQLARLALAEVPGTDLDVLVGGLGLGYTASTVLLDARVRSLVVVEALDEVIGWHERDLLPDTVGLAADPRLRLVSGDFFALVADKDPTPASPAGGSRRSSSTSTTLPDTFFIPATRRSTARTGCAGFAGTYGPAGCSPCGRTIRPTTTSWPGWPRSSAPSGRRWSDSRTRSQAASRRTPSTSPAEGCCRRHRARPQCARIVAH